MAEWLKAFVTDSLKQSLIAGAIAGLLTLFELDRIFYVPSKTGSRIALNSWWWGFIVANGALAGILCTAVSDLGPMHEINAGLKGLVIGVGYLALIRLKFFTVKLQGAEVPVGLDVVYEGAKAFFFRRINRIAKNARYAETTELAAGKALAELIANAKLSIEQDALLTAEEKRDAKDWLLKVIADNGATDDEKRRSVADFILSGHMSGVV